MRSVRGYPFRSCAGGALGAPDSCGGVRGGLSGAATSLADVESRSLPALRPIPRGFSRDTRKESMEAGNINTAESLALSETCPAPHPTGTRGRPKEWCLRKGERKRRDATCRGEGSDGLTRFRIPVLVATAVFVERSYAELVVDRIRTM